MTQPTALYVQLHRNKSTCMDPWSLGAFPHIRLCIQGELSHSFLCLYAGESGSLQPGATSAYL